MKAERKMMAGALHGVRVLDISRVLAGPWAGQIFGDLGADVIKVERPIVGDETRAWGPPYLRNDAGEETAEAAYFLSANRNKRSIAIDFTRPEGQEIVRKIAVSSDILLENFKLGGLQQYGLDYQSLRAVNPRLIYCSITGFGQYGPYAHRAGYDFLIQGMGGLMSITGRKEGEPGAGPQKVGVALTDVMTGLYSVVSVLAALHHRALTGEGQHVDMALLDVQVTSLANQAMNFLTSGIAPKRLGNAHPSIVPYQDFPTTDGAVIIAVGNDSQFEFLCRILGHAEWARDDRFRTNAARVKNRDDIVGLIGKVTALQSTKAWVEACEAVGVPCGPINDIEDVFSDPQIVARGLRIEMPHPVAGSVPLVASPIHMSASPVEYRRPPPLLGEHTVEILQETVGYDAQMIESLERMGVVQSGVRL